MKRPLLIFTLSAVTLAGQVACSDDRLLVGQSPDGGGQSSGSGGSIGSGGTTGTTGSGGAAPSTGTGGATITRSQRPLQISGKDALTRMTTLIWNAPPDDDLLSQDTLGHFKTVEDLYGPARQILADPRATVGVGAFYRWWLKLDNLAMVTKDATVFPQWNAPLATDMANEAETFGVKVTLDLNGTYQTLLTAPFSFLNARLAAIYGLSGVTGDALQQVSLTGQQRSGLLTIPALQALASNPNRNNVPGRGVNVSEQMLCSIIPPPPPNVPPLANPVPPGLTTRQELETVHASNPACSACHSLIDPPGLAFEGFDAIGQPRATDNGQPVDVSGLTLRLNGTDYPFNGPIELANFLSTNDTAETCMATQWIAFAFNEDRRGVTSVQQQRDAAALAQVMDPFRTAGFNLKELIADVMLTDAFLAP
ncbi:MAG TPA: DUF1588 domain-containing protein [Polyangia bacterium]|jgi:hypothetical protein|nr:DUF1588 domain-containing protein [Polyangia bacterium]